MGEAKLPHVNYEELHVGVVYAVRPEHLMSLEPAMYLGRCWKRLQDGRVVRKRAWAQPGKGGWWRPTWAWGLRMRWEDYLSLPEGDRPL